MLEERFIDGEGMYYRTGLGCYAWYVFEKSNQDYTKLYKIDNNMYVLGSKDCEYKYDRKNNKIKKK
jgi:hypothetical protein